MDDENKEREQLLTERAEMRVRLENLEAAVAERGRLADALQVCREKLKTLYDNANDEIVYTDLDGTIVDVNYKVKDIYGYRPEEVIGRNYTEIGFLGPDDLETAAGVIRDIMEGKPGRLLEFETFRKNGTKVFIEVNSKLILENGKAKGFLNIIRDVTERKQSERELRRHRDHLRELVEERTAELNKTVGKLQQEVADRLQAEDKIKKLNEELELRVKERTAELEKAYAYLKQLDKMKDSFLSSVSHELRTPLTSIRSFSEILLQYEDEDPATRKEFIQIIQMESERLTRLINDFLDLSKIESGKAAYHDDLVSLEEIIRHTTRLQHQILKGKSLALTLEVSPDLPFVFADRDRIQQVITNLLGNAVKFSNEGGEIRLQAEAFQGKRSGDASDWIRVTVSDKGVGIDEKDFEIIFDKFGQVCTDTLKDKPTGTGLGLPICREIVTHYGGNIWVESLKGKGSSFHFTLPAAPFSAVALQEVATDSPTVLAEKARTILVVDDNPNMRRLLRHHLAKRGYNVLTAAGGKQALEMAARHPVDLITLDLMMPAMSGYDLLGMIRDDPATAKIPVLVISVIADKEKGILLGANDHLTKPFREGELLEKVRPLLGERESSILVVDDEPIVLDMLRAQLQAIGYLVTIARNGEEAIEHLQSHVPDLVILDVMLPGKSGYDVLTWIRNEPRTSTLPVVLMSGYPLSKEQSEFLKMEADAFVGKAEGLRSLFKKVDSILK